MNSLKIKLTLLLLVMIVSLSCKKTIQTDVVESTKELSGAWQIISITQNGDDLSSLIDLTKYKITFSGKNYTSTGDLPFLAKKSGVWEFNDPQYPFAISFTPQGGSKVTTELNYPIVGNQRRMTMTFDLGCNKNSYTYTLKPVNQ